MGTARGSSSDGRPGGSPRKHRDGRPRAQNSTPVSSWPRSNGSGPSCGQSTPSYGTSRSGRGSAAQAAPGDILHTSGTAAMLTVASRTDGGTAVRYAVRGHGRTTRPEGVGVEESLPEETSQSVSENVSDGVTSFADLGLRPELLKALSDLGYEEPTPIQREAIPPLLEGRDLVGQAATGTGKTAAFALPVLQQLAGDGDRTAPAALVLVPTRELAVQVSQAFHRYGRGMGVRVLPIYGGQPIGWQVKALERGVDVVVATPGRALDHIGRGTFRPQEVEAVVLDEADEMLDMGFAEDIEEILRSTPEERRTVLFSATLPPRFMGLA